MDYLKNVPVCVWEKYYLKSHLFRHLHKMYLSIRSDTPTYPHTGNWKYHFCNLRDKKSVKVQSSAILFYSSMVVCRSHRTSNMNAWLLSNCGESILQLTNTRQAVSGHRDPSFPSEPWCSHCISSGFYWSIPSIYGKKKKTSKYKTLLKSVNCDVFNHF